MNTQMTKTLAAGTTALFLALSVSATSMAKTHSHPPTFQVHSSVDTVNGVSYTIYTIQYVNPNGHPAVPIHTNWLKISDNQTAVSAQMMFYPVVNGALKTQGVKPGLVPTFLHGTLTAQNQGQFQFAVMNGHEGTAPITFTITDRQLQQTKMVGYEYHMGPAMYGVVGPALCDKWGCIGFYNIAPGQTTITLPVTVEDHWQNLVPTTATVDLAPTRISPDYSMTLNGQTYSWQDPIYDNNLTSYMQPLTTHGGQSTATLAITGAPAKAGPATAIVISAALPGVLSSVQQSALVDTLFLQFPSVSNYGTQMGWGTIRNQDNLSQSLTLPTAMHVGEQLSEALFNIKNLPIYPVMENAQGAPITDQRYIYHFQMTSSNPAVINVPPPTSTQGFNAVAEHPGTTTVTIWCPDDSAQPTVQETITVLGNS